MSLHSKKYLWISFFLSIIPFITFTINLYHFLQEAFNAFHNDMTLVKKYLKPIHVGSLADNEESEIKKDFRKLKETATKMVSRKQMIAFR